MELKYILFICMLLCFMIGIVFGAVITHDYFEKKSSEKLSYYVEKIENNTFKIEGYNAIKIQ